MVLPNLMLMQANLSVPGTFKVESLSYDAEIRRDKCFLDIKYFQLTVFTGT